MLLRDLRGRPRFSVLYCVKVFRIDKPRVSTFNAFNLRFNQRTHAVRCHPNLPPPCRANDPHGPSIALKTTMAGNQFPLTKEDPAFIVPEFKRAGDFR